MHLYWHVNSFSVFTQMDKHLTILSKGHNAILIFEINQSNDMSNPKLSTNQWLKSLTMVYRSRTMVYRPTMVYRRQCMRRARGTALNLNPAPTANFQSATARHPSLWRVGRQGAREWTRVLSTGGVSWAALGTLTSVYSRVAYGRLQGCNIQKFTFKNHSY
jgi:hypothetical protein